MKKSNSSPPPAFPDLEISSASTALLYASENTHTHSLGFLTDKTTCSNTSSSFPGCSMPTEVRVFYFLLFCNLTEFKSERKREDAAACISLHPVPSLSLSLSLICSLTQISFMLVHTHCSKFCSISLMPHLSHTYPHTQTQITS